MDLYLVKFSSEDCGTCHRMSHYDLKVTNELGCEFVDVKLQDTITYRKYRNILLSKYPEKKGMGWPTYLLVSSLEDDYKVLGEIKGGMSKGDFRNNLTEIIKPYV